MRTPTNSTFLSRGCSGRPFSASPALLSHRERGEERKRAATGLGLLTSQRGEMVANGWSFLPHMGSNRLPAALQWPYARSEHKRLLFRLNFLTSPPTSSFPRWRRLPGTIRRRLGALLVGEGVSGVLPSPFFPRPGQQAVRRAPRRPLLLSSCPLPSFPLSPSPRPSAWPGWPLAGREGAGERGSGVGEVGLR